MPGLRATALIAAASLGLHELRYVIGYGHHAEEVLAVQGHGYLSLAGAGAALLLAAAAVQLLGRVAGAWRTGAGAGTALPFGLTWLAASLALAGVYTGQELLEGALSGGHPGGLAALAAHGGLAAYPLALAFGAVVALVLRGADAVVEAAGRLSPSRRPRRASRAALTPRAPSRSFSPLRMALAFGRAVRGPPRLA